MTEAIMLHNPPDGSEVGTVVDATSSSGMEVMFVFTESGCIADDEKDKLDPDVLLSVIRLPSKRMPDGVIVAGKNCT